MTLGALLTTLVPLLGVDQVTGTPCKLRHRRVEHAATSSCLIVKTTSEALAHINRLKHELPFISLSRPCIHHGSSFIALRVHTDQSFKFFSLENFKGERGLNFLQALFLLLIGNSHYFLKLRLMILYDVWQGHSL